MESEPKTVRGWLETLTLENAPDWSDCIGLEHSCGTLQQAVSHIALHIKGITAKRYWNGACDRIYCYGKTDYKARWRAYNAGYAAMDAHLEAILQRQKAAIVPETHRIPCPDCHGSGCPRCSGDGWLDVESPSQSGATISFSGGPKEWKEFNTCKIYQTDAGIVIEGDTLPIDRVWDAIEALQSIAFNHFGPERYNVGRMPIPETLPTEVIEVWEKRPDGHILVAPDDYERLCKESASYRAMMDKLEDFSGFIEDFKNRSV